MNVTKQVCFEVDKDANEWIKTCNILEGTTTAAEVLSDNEENSWISGAEKHEKLNETVGNSIAGADIFFAKRLFRSAKNNNDLIISDGGNPPNTILEGEVQTESTVEHTSNNINKSTTQYPRSKNN